MASVEPILPLVAAACFPLQGYPSQRGRELEFSLCPLYIALFPECWPSGF